MVQCSITSGTIKSGDSDGSVYYETTGGVIAYGMLSGFRPLDLVSSFSVNIYIKALFADLLE